MHRQRRRSQRQPQQQLPCPQACRKLLQAPAGEVESGQAGQLAHFQFFLLVTDSHVLFMHFFDDVSVTSLWVTHPLYPH